MANAISRTVLKKIQSDGITIDVPCSTSNFGPGFDCLGAALDRFLTIRVRPGDEDLTLSYENGHQPEVTPENDLILTTLNQTLDELGASAPPLHLRAHSDIPPGGGLGSSAAAVAAGGALAQFLVTGDVDRNKLFERGYLIEGHPDNIAPAVFGAVTLSYVPDENVPRSVRITSDLPGLFLVRPDVRVETEKARELLPGELPHRDAVFNLTRTGLLVHAMKSGRTDLLAEAMRDRIHQPYRARLLPGGMDVLNAGLDAGALGVWISGAGPTLGCFVREEDDAPPRAMVEELKRNGASAELMPARLCERGLQVSDENGTDRL